MLDHQLQVNQLGLSQICIFIHIANNSAVIDTSIHLSTTHI